MVALLEEGKIVHDAKISFSFEEIHGCLNNEKFIYPFLSVQFRELL